MGLRTDNGLRDRPAEDLTPNEDLAAGQQEVQVQHA